MGNTQNFIEINGKLYDAVTGVMVGTSQTKPATHNKTTMPPVVDGFVRRPKSTDSVRSNGLQTPLQHSVKPQKANTLMRQAVKKPVHKLSNPAQPKPTAAKTLFGKAVITPRVAATTPHREHMAKTTPQSGFVHKFSAPSYGSIPPKIAPLEVRPMPTVDAQVLNTPKTRASSTADLLDKALQAAEGHKEPFYEHKKSLRHRVADKVGVSSRAIAISATVLVGLFVGGFYALHNVPRLAMRVAASRAGFSAAMPDYSPAGFSFNGPVQYSAGQVVVGFKSNTDDRAYKLTQQTSSWTSDSLLNNFITNGGKQYQTYQDRGRTIYIYDGANATWVNGGVWYQIEGKSDLTSDQLVRIAASL